MTVCDCFAEPRQIFLFRNLRCRSKLPSCAAINVVTIYTILHLLATAWSTVGLLAAAGHDIVLPCWCTLCATLARYHER